MSLKKCETFEEVLELIRKEREEFGTKWIINEYGEICTKEGFCPVCKIANSYTASKFTWEANFANREFLHWDQEVVSSITSAADCFLNPRREQLEEACGLRT